MQPTVRVLFAATDLLNDDTAYARAEAAVGEERRAKADRLYRRSDRNLCLGAGLLLRRALREFGVTVPHIALTEHGKPYLPDTPDLHFNLSHAGNIVLCAVSPMEIGCDVEWIDQTFPAEKIAARFFTPSEYRRVMQEPTEPLQIITFFRLWTMKESYMKATGRGMSLPMNAFEVTLQSSPAVHDPENPTPCYLREIEITPHCRAAVCMVNHPHPLQIEEIALDDCLKS